MNNPQIVFPNVTSNSDGDIIHSGIFPCDDGTWTVIATCSSLRKPYYQTGMSFERAVNVSRTEVFKEWFSGMREEAA